MLLLKEPTNRISSEDALNHTWFKKREEDFCDLVNDFSDSMLSEEQNRRHIDYS